MNYENPFDTSSESETEKPSDKESHSDREARIETLPLQRRQPDQMLISSDDENDSGVNMAPGTSKSTVRFRTPKQKVEDNKENLGAQSCPPNVRASRLGERNSDADISTAHDLIRSDEDIENLPRTPEKQKRCKRPRSSVDVEEECFEKNSFEELGNTELSSDDSGPPRNEFTYYFVNTIFMIKKDFAYTI